jgi:hypothetical protein
VERLRVALHHEEVQLQAKTNVPQQHPGNAQELAAGLDSVAVMDRWEAEKKLHWRLEVLRARLADKSRELSASDTELMKCREALEEARRRESASREMLLVAQDQVARAHKDQETALVHGLAEMRSREQLSRQLHAAEQRLCHIDETLRPHVSLSSGTATPATPLVVDDEWSTAQQLVRHEQKVMDQSFALQQQEQTIAQLHARLHDLTAYRSTLDALVGAAERASTAHKVPGRTSSRVTKTGPSFAGSEELSAVLERMTRVVEKLQRENTVLQRNAVSNVKLVHLAKENKRLRAQAAEAHEQRTAPAKDPAASSSKLAPRSRAWQVNDPFNAKWQEGAKQQKELLHKSRLLVELGDQLTIALRAHAELQRTADANRKHVQTTEPAL